MAEVIERLPFEDYIKLPGEHSTGLRKMLTSPLEYRHNKDNPREDKDVFRVGRAAHTASLELTRFLLEYALFDGRRAGKKWQAFQEMHAGKTILTAAQYNTAIAISEAIRGHAVAGPLMAERGKNELTITFTHERTGLPCKARIDRVCSAFVDIKTAREVGQREFGAAAARYGYAFQAAFYRYAALAAGLEPRPFKLVVAQAAAPYDVVVYTLDEATLDYGQEQVENTLTLVAQCNEASHWPGIAPIEAVPLVLPAWATMGLDDEPITFGDEVIG